MADEETLKITADTSQAQKELGDLEKAAEKTGESINESIGGEEASESVNAVAEAARKFAEELGFAGDEAAQFAQQMAENVEINNSAELSEDQLREALEASLAAIGLSVEQAKALNAERKKLGEQTKNNVVLEDLLESSSRRVNQQVRDAQFEIGKLVVEQDKLKRAGQANSETYRANEKELERLNKNYQDLTREAALLRSTQANLNQEMSRATRRAGQWGDDIRSMNQAINAFAPNLVKLGFQIAIAGQALKAFGEIGKNFGFALHAYDTLLPGLEAKLKSTGDAAEGMGEDFTSAAAALGSLDFSGAAAKIGQFLGKVISLNRGIGILPPTLGEATKANEKLRKEYTNIIGVANDLTRTHETEINSLRKKALGLAFVAEKQNESGKVEKYIREEILKTLDAYESAGEKAPPELLKIATALDIVSSKTKKAEETARAMSEKIIASITGETAEREKLTKALVDSIFSIEGYGELTAEVTEKIKAKVKEQMKAYTDFGEKVPDELQKVIDKYGVLTDAQDKALEASKKRIEEIATMTKKLGEEIAALEEKLKPKETDIFGNVLGETNESALELETTIKRLRGEPILSEEQRAQLDDAVDALAKLNAKPKQKSWEIAPTDEELAAMDELQAKRQEELALLFEASWRQVDINRKQQEMTAAMEDTTESANGFVDEIRDAEGHIVALVNRTNNLGDGMEYVDHRLSNVTDGFAAMGKEGANATFEFGKGIEMTGDYIEKFKEKAEDGMRPAIKTAEEMAKIFRVDMPQAIDATVEKLVIINDLSQQIEVKLGKWRLGGG